MNQTSKITILLGIVSALLLAGLVFRHLQATKVEQAKEDKIKTVETTLTETQAKLTSQTKTNEVLRSELEIKTEALQSLEGRYATVTTELDKVQKEADAAASEVAAAKKTIEEMDKRIGELSIERDSLTTQMTELNSNMESLEGQILETQRKLEASEGDREFLLKELKRLQAEKADLERQFNDLALLRNQIRKLKDELSIARRLEWIKNGIMGAGTVPKGAALLKRGFSKPETKPNFDLNVELNQEGGVQVVPSNGQQ
jgi:chromosome segregation protein